MSPTEFTKSVIALACWRAASNETYQVMLSVCMVFKNRAEFAPNGDIYTEACLWLDENPGEFPDARDPTFSNMLSRLDGVSSGFVPDKTGGALWFMPKSSETPLLGQITCSMGQMNFIR